MKKLKSEFDYPTSMSSDWVRLRTFVQLRWVAILGQIIAVLVAYFWLHIHLNIAAVFSIILLWTLFNAVQATVFHSKTPLSEPVVFAILLVDLIEISSLLWFSGGLSNPFAMLLVVPVVIAAAAAININVVFALFGVLMLVIIFLWQGAPPLMMNGIFITPNPYLRLGFAVSILVTVLFLSAFTRRITKETMDMSLALAATQEALLREQKITALGGVVSALAHELGTPLATIKLTAAELRDELEDLDGMEALAQDAALIRNQAERCRNILQDMGDAGKMDMLVQTVPLLNLIEDAAEPHLDRGKEVVVFVNDEEVLGDAIDTPYVKRAPEILHGLRNLIQNAVDFAKHEVRIDIYLLPEEIEVRVADDGGGYPSDVLPRLGEPFLRSRNVDGRDFRGMGLGLFIAKTLLNRTHGQVTFSNLAGANGALRGAVANVSWRREDIEVSREKAHGALGDNPMQSAVSHAH